MYLVCSLQEFQDELMILLRLNITNLNYKAFIGTLPKVGIMPFNINIRVLELVSQGSVVREKHKKIQVIKLK